MASTAGEFFRRAAGGVSSTLAQASSSVTSAAQGRKRYDVSDDVLEKCNLTIKCTPNKDAVTTTAMAIKAGYLMKRNEQGQWQRRYICTVPHLFLYYFDSDSSDAPRAVIDLELYTNISRHKNFLKVAATNEEKMRSFHFQSDDNDTLNDWLTHFMRDRYYAVCDERNAYQHMQSEMTAVLDTFACQTKAVEIDKEIVEKQLQEALLAKQQALSVLHNILAIVGITEEESAKLQNLDRIAHCLESNITNMKRELEMKFFGPDEALEAEKAARKADISALEEAVELEVRARKNVEAMLLKAKKAGELQERELQGQIDTFQLNFQMLATAKADADTKCAKLSDEKKLLIKEIKRLRAQLTETEANLEKVEAVNGRFTQSLLSLQAHLRSAEETNAELRRAAAVAEKEYVHREQAAVTAAVVAALDSIAMGSQKNQQATSPGAVGDARVSECGDALPAVPQSHSADSATTASSDSADSTPLVLLVPRETDGETAEDARPTSSAAASADPVADSAASPVDDAAPSAHPGNATTDSITATEPPAEVIVLSTQEVQSLLEESQSIMANLRPLPGASGSAVRRSGSGTEESPRGTLSASNSATNMRDRRNSGDSSHSGSGGGGTNNCPPSPQDLRDLGWLSPEQEKLVDRRLQLHAQQHAEVEPQYRYLSTSNTTAAVDGNGSHFQYPPQEGGAEGSGSTRSGRSGSDTGVHAQGSASSGSAVDAASSMAASAASAAAAHSMSMLSGAMSLLSSTASSMQGGAEGSDECATSVKTPAPSGSGGSSKQAQRGILSSMFQPGASAGAHGEGGEEDPERLPSAMRLNCLRCAGTVEGPKYSTCTCSVPALVPEDLQSKSSAGSGSGAGASSGKSSSWGFSGMFTKSSTVFKESLAKASQVTASNVESLMHMTKTSTAQESSTGSTAGVKDRSTEGYMFYNTVVSTPGTPAAPSTSTADTATTAETSPAPATTATTATTAPAPVAVIPVAQTESKISPEKELWGYFTGTAPQPAVNPASTADAEVQEEAGGAESESTEEAAQAQTASADGSVAAGAEEGAAADPDSLAASSN